MKINIVYVFLGRKKPSINIITEELNNSSDNILCGKLPFYFKMLIFIYYYLGCFLFLDYLEFYSSGNSDTPSKRAKDDGTTVKKASKIRKRTLSSSSKTDPKEFYPVKNEEDQTRILQQHSTVIPLPIVVEIISNIK